MTVTIRAAAADDVPAMHRIRSAVQENRLSNRAAITESDYLPYVHAGDTWVAQAGGGIVGFAALDRAAGSVWALFVAPDAEGLGIGRALHDALIRSARAQGPRTLSLSTAPGTRAEHFYERAGWRNAGFTEAGEIRFEKSLTV